MQVTPEMIEAARGSLGRFTLMTDFEIAKMIHAALGAMPKATGGVIPGPGQLVPQPADITPPQKVRDAAAAVPEITFNLDQQYGGMDEAALKKLRMAMGGSADQAADE